MKISKKDLQKVMDYIKKHGDEDTLDFEIDSNIHKGIIIKSAAYSEPVSFIVFNAELGVMPKITRTERL